MQKHSDSKIVDIFGGPSALAKALGLERQVVHNWTLRGISKVGKYMLRDYSKKTKVRLPEGFGP